MRTYFTVKNADGTDTPAQAKKLGSPRYGYPSVKTALRYCPIGGYVEERHQTNSDDWAGRIVARK